MMEIKRILGDLNTLCIIIFFLFCGCQSAYGLKY